MAEQKKESELAKARGETEAQKAQNEYNKGDFQTTDPVTGEPRGKMGANWQDADSLEENIIGEELSPADVKARQEEEVARSSGDAPKAARKAAKKSKRGR